MLNIGVSSPLSLGGTGHAQYRGLSLGGTSKEQYATTGTLEGGGDVVRVKHFTALCVYATITSTRVLAALQ